LDGVHVSSGSNQHTTFSESMHESLGSEGGENSAEPERGGGGSGHSSSSSSSRSDIGNGSKRTKQPPVVVFISSLALDDAIQPLERWV